MNLASYIDHTILKPDTTITGIEKVCREALHYQFASVCIPPYFVKNAAGFLSGSSIKVATVIGFPFGYQAYTAKLAEAENAIAGGALELDMVMNIAAFKNNDIACLEKEVAEILSITKPGQILLKIIIESGILTDKEIIQCCNFYKNFEIDFLKTSTGYAEKGATLEAVQLMRKQLPSHIQIKASGGIKTFGFAKELIMAGATRLGCSAGVAIVNEEITAGNGY
jgi:deoxyribose-phosphate aldolase